MARPIQQTMMTPHVPVSWGELLDKITILEIKLDRIGSPNVRHELDLLLGIAKLESLMVVVGNLLYELREVNLRLWEVEDAIRVKEAQGQFDDSFIELARSVYRLNDIRAHIKKSVNLLLDSELVEEKSYKDAGIL
jgi:hypothetical protein